MWKAALALVLGWGFAASWAGAEEAKYVKLVHVATGKVLAIADASGDAGAKAVLAGDDGSEAQAWKLEKDGEYYKLVNRKSGKVLDVEGDSKDEGASIIQWDEKGEENDNQRWSWEGGEGARRLKSKSSGFVLDVGDDGTAVVQKKSDANAKAQVWRVMPATGPKYVKLVQAEGRKVLAIANNSDENEAKAVAAKDDGSPGQQWRLVADGEYYKIVNRKSGKVLDVFNGSMDEGAQIIQWDDKAEENDNQRWSWDGGGKARRLKSKSSGLVMDVGDEDAAVQKKADDAAKGQLWQVVEVKE